MESVLHISGSVDDYVAVRSSGTASTSPAPVRRAARLILIFAELTL
jgi:hypothetical protein